MDAVSDLDALALRAKAGERDALEALVSGLQDRMYRLAVRMLGRADPARDATQEILVLVITRLSRFRGDSSVVTWAYRIAVRYLARQRRRAERWTFEQLAEDLGKPPNEIAEQTLARAEASLLEEETFLGCTQAMLLSLAPDQRLAFTLGALCDLSLAEAAAIVGISEVAFRKRLSRARQTLDAFLTKHCGVSDPRNACRCAFQVNFNVARGRPLPEHRQLASGQVLRALRELRGVRRSLTIYQAQPAHQLDAEAAAQLRALISSTSLFGH